MGTGQESGKVFGWPLRVLSSLSRDIHFLHGGIGRLIDRIDRKSPHPGNSQSLWLELTF